VYSNLYRYWFSPSIGYFLTPRISEVVFLTTLGDTNTEMEIDNSITAIRNTTDSIETIVTSCLDEWISKIGIDGAIRTSAKRRCIESRTNYSLS
ncbi:hypothetical protein PENTCL1PPCAC_15818, partial [Pristionchus entomophagus]